MDDGRIRYLSLFSGIECLSVAVAGLGWEPVAFSEIEKGPCRLLAEKYPGVPNLGDVRNIRYDKERDELTNGTTSIPLRGKGIDVIAGGFPCQSVSVAGKRAGMRAGSGTRSSLGHELLRLVGEIRPSVFLIENVPGLLSSGRGADFTEFLREMAELGYNVAWRVLDAQYTRTHRFPRAVPQRRRRVWIVGHSGADWRTPAEILFEPAGLLGDTPPRRETGQGAAAPAGERAAEDDRVVGGPEAVACGNGQLNQVEPEPVAKTLDTMHDAQKVVECRGGDCQLSPTGGKDVNQWWNGENVAASITANSHHQEMPDKGNMEAVVTRPSDVCVSFDRAAYNQGADALYRPSYLDDGSAPTMVAKGPGGVAVDNDSLRIGDATRTLSGDHESRVTDTGTSVVQTNCLTPEHPLTHRVYSPDGSSPTLFANTGGGQNQQAVLVPANDGKAPQDTRQGEERPAACILQMRGGVEVDSNGHKAGKGPLIKCEVAPCIAAAQDTTLFAPIPARGNTSGKLEATSVCTTQYGTEIAGTLRAEADGMPTHNSGQNAVAVGFKGGQSSRAGLGCEEETSPTLAAEPSALEPTVALPQMIVRRLTPLECERLQGLPDNYTACIGADSPRYKACGNAWAVNCAEWVATRITKLLREGNTP